MSYFLIFIGILELLFGIFKVAVIFCLFFVPEKYTKDIPILNKILVNANDNTLAGHLYEYVLLIIGIYSILSALTIFGVLPEWFIDQQLVEFVLFTGLGAIMVVFYSLVLYTNLPITKNVNNYHYYFLLGLLGGITLIAIPIILQSIYYIVPVFHQLHSSVKTIIILVAFIIITLIIEYTYYLYKNNSPTIQVLLNSSYIPDNVPIIESEKK
jgi:hypothetical protein